MTVPIIGLVPQIDSDKYFKYVRLFPEYQASVEKAGGVGLMIPHTKDKKIMRMIVELCDGFIFTGGHDIDPRLYGEKESAYVSMSTGYSPERDEFETTFYPLVKEMNKPILAICRGFQIINVIHGGTMIQDLPYEPYDGNYILHPAWTEEGNLVHDINVKPNTKLHKILKKDIVSVNSYHHQGVKKLGKGLTISGVAPDGLIEAYDIDDLDFGIGVQWHPEVLYTKDYNSGKLFKAFIEECKKRREKNN